MVRCKEFLLILQYINNIAHWAKSQGLGLPFVAGILDDIHSIGKDGFVHIIHTLSQAANTLIGSKQTIG